MSWRLEVKGRRMRKTAILLTACKCMSGRLMVLAILLGGGYAGLRRGRTHSACAGEAEAQGIQRLPQKTSRRSALGAVSACGTKPLSPSRFPFFFLTAPPRFCIFGTLISSQRHFCPRLWDGTSLGPLLLRLRCGDLPALRR